MSEVASRVRALREALELTQDELGRRAGHGANGRVYLSKIETGKNQLNTVASRDQLARGFGLSRDDLDAYPPVALPSRLPWARQGGCSRRQSRGRAEGHATAASLLRATSARTPSRRACSGRLIANATPSATLMPCARVARLCADARAWRRSDRPSRESGFDAAASLRKQGDSVTLESPLLRGHGRIEERAGLPDLEEPTDQRRRRDAGRQRADQAPKKIWSSRTVPRKRT